MRGRKFFFLDLIKFQETVLVIITYYIRNFIFKRKRIFLPKSYFIKLDNLLIMSFDLCPFSSFLIYTYVLRPSSQHNSPSRRHGSPPRTSVWWTQTKTETVNVGTLEPVWSLETTLSQTSRHFVFIIICGWSTLTLLLISYFMYK